MGAIGYMELVGDCGIPAAVSVTPNSGSGTIQTFALQYSDTYGAANLKLVYAWFNTQDAVNNSCELYYNAGTHQINLLNDAATAWMSATPGTATTLQNSQCSLNVAAATVTPSGNNLTLSLPMTFEELLSPEPRASICPRSDVSGPNSGWQQLGTLDCAGHHWHICGGFGDTELGLQCDPDLHTGVFRYVWRGQPAGSWCTPGSTRRTP